MDEDKVSSRPQHVLSNCAGSGKILPTCDVVVCTLDRPVQLNDCLQALRKLCYPNLNILVVDNGSENRATFEVCEKWGAQYKREPRVGLSRARNFGARESKSEIVAFIDDDAIPSPDWLCSLAQEFIDPLVIAATGPIHPLNYTSTGEVEPFSGIIKGRTERRVFSLSDPDWFTKSNFGGIGDGSNMAFRRKGFELWPGFHESLGRGTVVHGSEEHYAFFELIRRGHRIAFTPSAIVYHPFVNDPKEARAKQLKDLCAATAYMTFFFIQQPHYRIPLMRFLVGAAGRWTFGRPKSAANSFLVELRSLFSGPIQYFRSRAKGTVRSADNSSLRHEKRAHL